MKEKIVETNRLYLRPMKDRDLENLKAILMDERIMQHYPYRFDEQMVKQWIERNQKRYATFGFGLWAVCLKENDLLIGDCGLTIQWIDQEALAEIGYHIHHDYQRKGYGKEAAEAVLAWTFEHTPFQIVFSYMKYTNHPSALLAQALGLEYVKEYQDEGNQITKVYAITKEKWLYKKKEGL